MVRVRARARRLQALEFAIAFALVGSIAVVAIPAFVRDLHASHLIEATDGLARMAKSTQMLIAERRALLSGAVPLGIGKQDRPSDLLPASAPLTPAEVPRGVFREDAVGTWDHPTWQALGFRATREGVPHAFSFAIRRDRARRSRWRRGLVYV
jgi:hypothetical protein